MKGRKSEQPQPGSKHGKCPKCENEEGASLVCDHLFGGWRRRRRRRRRRNPRSRPILSRFGLRLFDLGKARFPREFVSQLVVERSSLGRYRLLRSFICRRLRNDCPGCGSRSHLLRRQVSPTERTPRHWSGKGVPALSQNGLRGHGLSRRVRVRHLSSVRQPSRRFSVRHPPFLSPTEKIRTPRQGGIRRIG